MRCVLCESFFASTSDEHLMPNAIGWRYHTARWICAECNAATSRYDDALAKSVEFLTTVIDPAGRRFPAPSIHFNSDWGRVTLLAGGGTSMNPEVPFISSAGEEMLSVSREAMNDTEAKMLARGKRLEWVGDTDTLRHVVAAPFEFGSEAMRSLAKTAVHATADFFGERAALGASQSRRLRNLALGLPDALAGLVVWDYASAEMASEPFYHGVEATACPTTGILSVRVHVYGLWRVRFLVSDTYRGRLHSVRTRITDPIGDSQRVTPTRCRHPIPWLTMRERGPAYRDLRARAYLATHGSMFESATLTNLNRFERPEEWGRPPI